MAAARRGARPALRKRYYDKAATAVTAEGHAVHLDSKPVHTPAGRVLAAPTLAYLDLLSGFGVFAIGRNHPVLRDAREAARLQPSKSCSDGCVDAARNTCRTAEPMAERAQYNTIELLHEEFKRRSAALKSSMRKAEQRAAQNWSTPPASWQRCAGDAALLSRHAVRYCRRALVLDRVSIPGRAIASLRRSGTAGLIGPAVAHVSSKLNLGELR